MDSSRSGREEFDAVFVGSGINGLVGAALLAKRGWKVAVLEREDWLGGAIRTVDTKGGFKTELMSCFFMQFAGSPGYRELAADLDRHGLRFANCDQPFAVVNDDGAMILTTDHAANVKMFEERCAGEGDAWDAAIGSFFGSAEDLLGSRDIYPWSKAGRRWLWQLYRRRGRAGSLSLLSELLMSARSWLEVSFQDPMTHALLAPWALHGAATPDDPGSATIIRAVAAFSEAGGTPVPVGGGSEVVEALAAIIGEHGGTCRTDVDVNEVLVENGRAKGVSTIGSGVITARRAVVCSVTPSQLYGRLLKETPETKLLRAHAKQIRPGNADFQLVYSLDREPTWAADPGLIDVGVVHICAGLEAVSKAANEGRRRLLPAEPSICCGQPMAVDGSRGPEGTWQLWIQQLEVPCEPKGDAAGEITVQHGWTKAVREAFADRIETRLAHHIPGFQDTIIERIALSPADLEAANINLIGGSSTSGAQDLDQMLLLRPSPLAPAPRTPVDNLFHIGASTHPGGSLAGGSGFLIAQHLAGRKSRFRRARP